MIDTITKEEEYKFKIVTRRKTVLRNLLRLHTVNWKLTMLTIRSNPDFFKASATNDCSRTSVTETKENERFCLPVALH